MTTRTRLMSALFAITLIAGACSDDSGDDTSPTTTTTAAPATTAPESVTTSTTTPPPTTAPAPVTRVSAGCGAVVANGAESLTLDTTDGLTRDYRLHTPAGYDADAATPVVLNFHGLTSNIDAQVSLSRLEPLADTETFIVVTPQGTENATGVPFWNSSSLVSDTVVNDVQFVHEFLDAVEASHCVDLDRVFSTGMSNGGFLSGQLACSMPERIAAIASVTGITWNRDCATDRDVPVLHFHGTADGVVNFEDIPERVAGWAADNGCVDTPATEAVSDEVERQVWSCPEGADVEFYIVDGGGHTWPGTPLPEPLATILGYTTTDIDATAIAWEWFKSHPMSNT
jgi:polyhydroxybutyrate depolymerase